MNRMRDKAIEHFKLVDPLLYEVLERAIDSKPSLKFPRKASADDYLRELCSLIVSQQLSVKAADAIWKRFIEMVGDPVLAETLLKFDQEAYRGIGISRQKYSYISSLAELTASGEVDLADIDTLSDQQVIETLVRYKGVGQWTAEMFLIFTLARPDVFSIGDLGLRRAITDNYGITDNDREKMIELSKKWAPYKSYACLALWRSLDNKPA